MRAFCPVALQCVPKIFESHPSRREVEEGKILYTTLLIIIGI